MDRCFKLSLVNKLAIDVLSRQFIVVLQVLSLQVLSLHVLSLQVLSLQVLSLQVLSHWMTFHPTNFYDNTEKSLRFNRLIGFLVKVDTPSLFSVIICSFLFF